MATFSHRSIAFLILILTTGTLAYSHEPTAPGELHFALSARQQPEPLEHCLLRIVLRVDGDDRVTPGIIRVSDDQENRIPLQELLPRGIGAHRDVLETGWHVVTGATEVRVPRRRLVLEALRGLETNLARVELDLRESDSHEVTITLRRIWNRREKNLYAGNTHLHLSGMTRREADRYLVDVNRADNVDVVFVSYLERYKVDAEYTSNAYRPGDLDKLSEPGVLFGWGEEYRHNFGPGGEGYGHVMFLDQSDLVLPASIGPGIARVGTDGVSLRPGIRAARADGATTIWCHNAFGFEDIPNFLEGLIDAQNIFDGGTTGDYGKSFYRYLNLGLRVPFSTGTDWFVYDFSRVYVPVRGELTTEKWLESLRGGRSFITNGPLIEFEVEGETPGRVIQADAPRELRITARAIGRHDFQSLELIRNGRIEHAAKSDHRGDHFTATLDTTLTVDKSAWLAARIRSENTNELGHPIFAHTSPVYVDFRGERVSDASATADVIKELRESIDAVKLAGDFESNEARDQVLGIYRRAIEHLNEPKP